MLTAPLIKSGVTNTITITCSNEKVQVLCANDVTYIESTHAILGLIKILRDLEQVPVLAACHPYQFAENILQIITEAHSYDLSCNVDYLVI